MCTGVRAGAPEAQGGQDQEPPGRRTQGNKPTLCSAMQMVFIP